MTTNQPNLGKPKPKSLNRRFGFYNHHIQRIVSSLNCPNLSLSKIIQAKCGRRKYGSWNSCDVATNAKSSVVPGLMGGLNHLKGNVIWHIGPGCWIKIGLGTWVPSAPKFIAQVNPIYQHCEKRLFPLFSFFLSFLKKQFYFSTINLYYFYVFPVLIKHHSLTLLRYGGKSRSMVFLFSSIKEIFFFKLENSRI